MPAHQPLPSAPPEWKPIRESVARLRAGQEVLENFVGQLLGDLEAAHTRLAESENQLLETQRHLAETRSELLHSLETSGSVDPIANDQLKASEKERTALEVELETVRVRAADLAESLAEQKKQMAEERAQWTNELRQMRRLLEKQADSAGHVSEVNHAVPAEPRAREHPPSRSSDPVLGSVMAQFESLQKDIAKRRAKSGGVNP